jgi:PAS domain S-box-containing protein
MRHRYLLGILIAVICSCLYLFQMIYSEIREKTIGELNSRQLIHARQASRGIEEYFNDLTLFLANAAEGSHIIDLDDIGKKEMAFSLKTKRHEVRAITRVDSEGRILYTLPYDKSAIGRDISYQKHIREIIRTKKPVVSDVFTAVQGYETIALHVPVFKGKEYRGSLCFLVDFQAVSRRFLKDINIGETGYAWMISRDGIELYCPVPGHTGKSVYENCKEFPSVISMAEQMVKGGQGVTTYTFNQIRDIKTETIKKQAVYFPVRVGDTFWSIVVVSNEDEALASLVSFRNKLFFVIGLLVLGGAIILYFGVKALVIVREEAKRKETEEALRESEKRYKSMFENNHAVMLLIDPESASIIDANPAACSFYGWSREEITKKRIDEINTLPKEKIRDEMDLARTERRNYFIFKHRLADGSERDVEVYSGPLTIKGKTLLFSIIYDITERKKAEDALKSSLSLLSASLESTADGILIVDRSGRISRWNRKFADMWGIPGDVLESRDDEKALKYVLNKLADPGRFIERVRYLYDHPEESSFDMVDFADGRVFERYSQPQRIENDIAGRVWSFRDITDRKKAEKDKDRMEEQYRQAQKMEAIGQLAGGIAHDFNNMLNIIIGYCQMATMKTEPSSPLRSSLQEIMNAAQRSAELVRQLLAFARKQTIAPRALDLNDTVSGMLNMLRKLIGEDVNLTWMPGANLWPVKMDPAQVDQILANLAVNARDSITGVGKIRIETGDAEIDDSCSARYPGSIPGHYTILSVSDNGCGMDEETLEKIFEPFFTTKEFGKGTGMGLATVYGIVKQNNGFIGVESKPGEGSSFKIFLPVFEGKDMAALDQVYEPEPLKGTETVLVVEDDKALLNMTETMLEELGYKVITAGTPGEALRLAEGDMNEIHILVTDVVMPEMSGKDLKEKICALKPCIKCLFMSGYTDNVIADHGVLEEGVIFLQKPFSMSELAFKVREALGKH